jgi:hypothetical protein
MTDETVNTVDHTAGDHTASDRMASDRMDGDMLLSRLPGEVWESFTAEQRAALWDASHTPTWRRYPINMRLAFPLLGNRYFLTVVGGIDRRNAERVRRERRMHPFATFGNFVFITAAAAVFYVGALFLLFLVSSVVEF